MDTPDNNMAKTWMMAAGQNGIPCAFVVGKDGKIAWIGHPMAGLDKAVKQALAASAPQTPRPVGPTATTRSPQPRRTARLVKSPAATMTHVRSWR